MIVLEPDQSEEVSRRVQIWTVLLEEEKPTPFPWLVASPVGWGKSYTALAALAALRELLRQKEHPSADAPVLILCELGAKAQWVQYIKEMGLGVAQEFFTSSRPEAVQSTAKWWVCHYAALSRLRPLLLSRDYMALIADEASRYLTNPKSQRYRVAIKVSALARIALDGTFLLRYPDRLWPILDMVAPGAWGSLESFSGRPIQDGSRWVERYGFCKWRQVWIPPKEGSRAGHFEWSVCGSRNLDHLARLLRPILTSRTRPGTPQAHIRWIGVRLEEEQKRLYHLAREGLMEHFSKQGGQWSARQIRSALVQIGTLRSICAMSPAAFLSNKLPEWAPRHTTPAGMGAKQKWLVEKCLPNVRKGDKLVVFSEWTRATKETTALLRAEGLRVEHIHGAVSPTTRRKILDEWNAGLLDALVGSPAMYNSLNLHRAAGKGYYIYTIMLDVPQWYKLQQRIGRTARHGAEATLICLILYAIGTKEVEWAAFGWERTQDFAEVFENGEPAKLYPASSREDILRMLQ